MQFGDHSFENPTTRSYRKMTEDEMSGIEGSRRVKTGIAGLDDILNGGLPEGHLYLVQATPERVRQVWRCSFCWKGSSAANA
jgi:hypothetical protein